IPLVPSFELPIDAMHIMAGRKKLDLGTDTLQGLQLGGYIKSTVPVPTNVQGNDPHMVAGYKIFILGTVVDGKSKDSVHFIKEVRPFFLIKGQDHLTI